MFLPEGITTLWQMSLTWQYLKGLLKVMQLITWLVITALLLRHLKWFTIDSLILESAEHLHFQPWRPSEVTAGAGSPDTGIHGPAPGAPQLVGALAQEQAPGWPPVLGVLNPVLINGLGKRDSPQAAEGLHQSRSLTEKERERGTAMLGP